MQQANKTIQLKNLQINKQEDLIQKQSDYIDSLETQEDIKLGVAIGTNVLWILVLALIKKNER